jgi:hypothetical protein
MIPLLLLLTFSLKVPAAPMCADVLAGEIRPTWQLRWLISENKTVSHLVRSITGNATDKNINVENLSSVLNAAISHPELVQTDSWPDTREYVHAARALRSRLQIFDSAIRRLQKQKKDSPKMVLALGDVLFADVQDSIYDFDFDSVSPGSNELTKAAVQSLKNKESIIEPDSTVTPISVEEYLKATDTLLKMNQPELAQSELNKIWQFFIQAGFGAKILESTQLVEQTIHLTDVAFNQIVNLYKGQIKNCPFLRDFAVIINNVPLLTGDQMGKLSPAARSELRTLQSQFKNIR